MSFQHLVPASIEYIQEHSLVLVAASLTATLFLWRVLKFSAIPAYYPSEPQELPYWLPCMISSFSQGGAVMPTERSEGGFGIASLYSEEQTHRGVTPLRWHHSPYGH